jgi:uncharacterized iron-regulated membrane protein
MKLRKILFWLHLSTGSVAGIVILVMSVTGILLAFERQINTWAAGRYRVAAPAGASRIPLELLLHNRPTTVTIRSGAAEPLEIGFGRERSVFVDPYSGVVLGESSIALRGFFSAVEKWHRTLGGELRKGAPGRFLTGACNLGFLFLVMSGFYLWWPRKWSWQHLRPVVLFRRGLAGRQRNWNWHNVTGFWCAVPLFFIVLTGVIMSYQWANNLLYELAGSPLPAAARRTESAAGDAKGIDGLFARAAQQVPEWRSISFRLPAAEERSITFSIDTGNGGQPNKRSQLTLNRKTGVVVRWEPFSGYSLGRRLRSWARFVHTGEAFGLPGQLIAAAASLGGALLVWTGLSLALRRLTKWLSARRETIQETAMSLQKEV